MADRLSGNRVEPLDGICQRRKWSVVSSPRATAVPRLLSLAVRRSRNIPGVWMRAFIESVNVHGARNGYDHNEFWPFPVPCSRTNKDSHASMRPNPH